LINLQKNRKMQFELTKDFIDRLTDIIDRQDSKAAISILDELHSADIAEIYNELNIEQAKFLFLLLDNEKASDVLAEIEEDDREEFLHSLPSEVIASHFLEEMDSDDAADVLGDLPEGKKEEVLSHIKDAEQAGDIADLLSYDEDTAGGLMAKELVSVKEEWDVSLCIEELRKQAEDVDEIYNVYVVDEHDRLKGLLPLKKLIISKPDVKVFSISEEVISVTTDVDSEDVANIMRKYDLVVLPVVDADGKLVGRITIDDIVDVIQEEAEKDYQMASGIVQDVEYSDNIVTQMRGRLPLLLIGLFGGVLGALVLGYYEGDLIKYAGLALFIPLIMAMAGNVGIQASAIVVQGIASKSMGIVSVFSKLTRELWLAFLIGIICSGLIFAYNIIFSDSIALSLTVSIALFSVIIFTTLLGTVIPLMLNKMKIDPALATGPFITTLNDIIGLLLYLVLSRILLPLF